MKKNKKSVNRGGRRSLKGKWGIVGAPPKKVSWPRGAFVMATLFARNSKGGNAQCELSLRNKVDEKLADGSLLALKPKKQAGGKVGRPKSVFVLKEHYMPSKHELAPSTVKRIVSTMTVATAPVATAPVTVAASPAPVEAVATPAPSAPVETSPVTAASPASPVPAIG